MERLRDERLSDRLATRVVDAFWKEGPGLMEELQQGATSRVIEWADAVGVCSGAGMATGTDEVMTSKEVVRKMGISESTGYRLKRMNGGLGTTALR